MAEGVLPGTYQPAEPSACRAVLVLKVDLDSLGPSASPDIETSRKKIWEVTTNQNGRSFMIWDKLTQPVTLRVSLHGVLHSLIIQ